MVRVIDDSLLNDLCKKAKSSDRKRINYNFHTSFKDSINRMLNAVEPNSYIQPHKHENPDKREVFLHVSGELLVIFFDDDGEITEHLILDGKKNFGVEIPPPIWHTIIAIQPNTVVYEIKDGPYSADNDKNFANWAPKEGETACEQYLLNTLQKLNLS